MKEGSEPFDSDVLVFVSGRFMLSLLPPLSGCLRCVVLALSLSQEDPNQSFDRLFNSQAGKRQEALDLLDTFRAQGIEVCIAWGMK